MGEELQREELDCELAFTLREGPGLLWNEMRLSFSSLAFSRPLWQNPKPVSDGSSKNHSHETSQAQKGQGCSLTKITKLQGHILIDLWAESIKWIHQGYKDPHHFPALSPPWS